MLLAISCLSVSTSVATSALESAATPEYWSIKSINCLKSSSDKFALSMLSHKGCVGFVNTSLIIITGLPSASTPSTLTVLENVSGGSISPTVEVISDLNMSPTLISLPSGNVVDVSVGASPVQLVASSLLAEISVPINLASCSPFSI